MTTIKLGVGDDAIEVEDGAVVPLTLAGQRGHIAALCEGGAVLFYEASRAFAVNCETGKTNDYAFGGHAVAIDLAALRRERAPRPQPKASWTSDGYWCRGVTTLAISQQTNGIPIGADREFWTHRPGNTPEKQAAFDAALDAYVRDVGPVSDTYTPSNALITAARALGYGAKR